MCGSSGMKHHWTAGRVVLLTAILGGLAIAAAGAAGRQSTSTRDGVYTAAQADKGAAIYLESCASCHGEDFSGGETAMPLVGHYFNTVWTGRSLGELMERMSTLMPEDAPGSLKPDEYAAVIAFLLSKGGFPAGRNELPSTTATLQTIIFVAPRP